MTAFPSRVLHLLLLELQPGEPRQAAARIAAGAQGLRQIPAVESTWTGLDETEADGAAVVVYVTLRDVLALADFGLDPAHIRFAGERVRPLVRRFTSVDLLLTGGPPLPTPYAHVVCAAVAPSVFEPQLRRLASAIAELHREAEVGGVAVGQAIDSRQPYRLGAIISLKDQPAAAAYRRKLPFRALVGPQWSELVGSSVEYLAEEVPAES